MTLWTTKYKPTNLKEIVGNKVNVKRAKLWIQNYKKSKENTKRALLISGAPGIGKTTLAHLLLEEFQYNTIEFNASDIRNQKLVKENLSNIMGKVSISSMMGGHKRNGVIMDEVDGMSSGDKGGLAELITFINPNKNIKSKKNYKKIVYDNPIICICNNDKDKKMNDLKKECEYIKFIPPAINELYEYAESIIKKEKMNIDDDKLLEITNFCQKDIRKLVSILEYLNNDPTINYKSLKKNKKLVKKKNQLNDKGDEKVKKNNPSNDKINQSKNTNNDSLETILGGLDKKEETAFLFNSVYKILNSYCGIEGTIKIFESDKNLINLLIHENIIGFLSNYKISEDEKINTILNVYKYFAESDIYDRELFINFNYECFTMSGILRCCYPSYLLNQSKKHTRSKYSVNDIQFSKLLSKFSLYYSNHKTKNYILNKLEIKSTLQDNNEAYLIILKKMIIDYNRSKVNKDKYIIKDNKVCIKYLIKKYNLNLEDFEKIAKLVKNKIKNTRFDEELKELAQTEYCDKKYLNKILKIY